jgi:hypothetical protein
LMVHPGDEHYAAESSLLTGRWWLELPFPITMLNYRDL